MLVFEQQLWQQGVDRVAGIDEAGRGPLAGPVVAAAVMIERDFLQAEQHGLLLGLTDSKQLTPKRREHFYALLVNEPSIAVSWAAVGSDEIILCRIPYFRLTHHDTRVLSNYLIDPIAIDVVQDKNHCSIVELRKRQVS